MRVLVSLLLPSMLAGCDPDAGDRCGPSVAVVERAVDGDTVELEGGRRVRYLLVDTPEISGEASECFGPEARQLNADLVEGQEVELSYDRQCEDDFDRLLAYVSVQGREVNRVLVERGFACVLYIPPNGEDRLEEFESLEATARAEDRGLWGACQEVPCD